jgi:hypothetical protein
LHAEIAYVIVDTTLEAGQYACEKPRVFSAVDLGASNGRVMKVDWEGNKVVLDEVHRFHNGGRKIFAE